MCAGIGSLRLSDTNYSDVESLDFYFRCTGDESKLSECPQDNIYFTPEHPEFFCTDVVTVVCHGGCKLYAQFSFHVSKHYKVHATTLRLRVRVHMNNS